MSERSLKLIFALVLVVFVSIGRNYNTDIENKKVAVNNIPKTQESTLTAKNPISKNNEEINLKAQVVSVVLEPTPTSPVVKSLVSQSREIDIISAPKVKATMFLIGDIEKHENIAQLSVDNRWPIASLSKLMTAVVALETLSPETLITIPESSLNIEGSPGFITPKRIFKLEDLIKAMVMVSSNQAAYSIQEHIGKEKFKNLMNETAKKIGMYNTYFDEATGLSVLNQSTAENLKILSKYIWATHKEIFNSSSLSEASIQDTVSNKKMIIKNINTFAGRADFLGGKTGFINESGGNLISIFSRSNKQIITIVLGADDRFLETKKLMDWFDKQVAI